MKYIAALLLALVGIGIFPVYQRSLFTPVGLIFAAMSVALFVIAYRLVRPRSKDAETGPYSPPNDIAAGQLQRIQSRREQPSSESDERLWSAALAEVEGQSRRPGLWAKAFSEAGGNESIAKAAYLKARVAELKNEPPAFIAELRSKGYKVEPNESRWNVVDPNGGITRTFTSLHAIEQQLPFLLSRVSDS